MSEITTKEAAQLTGYTERHIRRLANEKTIKARLVGERLYLVDRESLLAYVAEMKQLGNGKHDPTGGS